MVNSTSVAPGWPGGCGHRAWSRATGSGCVCRVPPTRSSLCSRWPERGRFRCRWMPPIPPRVYAGWSRTATCGWCWPAAGESRPWNEPVREPPCSIWPMRTATAACRRPHHVEVTSLTSSTLLVRLANPRALRFSNADWAPSPGHRRNAMASPPARGCCNLLPSPSTHRSWSSASPGPREAPSSSRRPVCSSATNWRSGCRAAMSPWSLQVPWPRSIPPVSTGSTPCWSVPRRAAPNSSHGSPLDVRCSTPTGRRRRRSRPRWPDHSQLVGTRLPSEAHWPVRACSCWIPCCDRSRSGSTVSSTSGAPVSLSAIAIAQA